MRIKNLASFIFFLTLSTNIFGQENIFAIVVDVKTPKEIVLLLDDNSTETVLLNDLVSIKEEYDSAIVYIEQQVMGKMVVAYVEKNIESRKHVTILYNCQHNPLLESELPCTSANNLNLELLSQKYVRYIGNNTWIRNRYGDN